MKRISLATAAVALAFAGVLTGAESARADANAPVCSYVNTLGGGGLRCDFYSFDQCRAAVSGLSGTCQPNPAVRASQNPMSSRRSSAY